MSQQPPDFNQGQPQQGNPQAPQQGLPPQQDNPQAPQQGLPPQQVNPDQPVYAQPAQPVYPQQGYPQQNPQDVYSQPAVQPQLVGQPYPNQNQGDATGGLIPYKNTPALLGYYMAVFSLIPGLGNILGLVAAIFGFVGLKKRKENPAVKGTAHCWVAIILGSLTFLFYNGAIVALIVAGIMNS